MKYFEYSLIGKRAAPVSSDARESKASLSSGGTLLSVLKRSIKYVQVKLFKQVNKANKTDPCKKLHSVQVELCFSSFKKVNQIGSGETF